MSSLASQVALLAENRNKILRYAFLFQFIAAAPFLWFAAKTGEKHAHLLVKGTKTSGTIVAVVPMHVSTATSYQAVISFSDTKDEYRFQEWTGSRIAPSVGARVSVIYDPADPDFAMIDRGYLNYLPWAPCAAIGVFLFLVALRGLFALLFSRAPSS